MSSEKAQTPVKPSPYLSILDFVILVGNACGNGPISFSTLTLIAFGSSYLAGYYNEHLPRPLLSGILLITLYYLIVGTYRLVLYNNYLDPILSIPGPKGHWLRGVSTIIRDSETAIPQRKWAKEYDNPMGVIAYSFLGASRLVPYSPAALAFFLNSPNYIKPQRTNNFIKVMIGDGILTAEHEVHKRQRRILTPAFAVSHVRAITPHFWTKANQLAEKWELLCQTPPEEGIEVSNWTSRATLDVIGFGFDFNSVESQDQPIALAYRTIFQPSPAISLTIYFSSLIPPLKYLPLRPTLELNRARDTIRDAALSMIRRTEGQKKEEIDILGVMIQENEKNKEEGREGDMLSEQEMVNQIMTFLAAGHETTSSSVSWALYFLSTHPEMQDRLRREVQTLDLDGSPSFEQVESLKYLNNVCREVTRFEPPVVMTIREADKDDVYHGIKIPSGTNVFISPGVINFDPATWGPDAEEFNPDRWNSLPEANSNYSYMTFLQGTRSCIGRKFAETEMKCLLAMLVGKFKFEEVVPGRIIEKETLLVVRPKGGLRLRVTSLSQ